MDVMAEKIEVSYDQLERFFNDFSRMEGSITTLHKSTEAKVDHLHGGEWIGRGSDKFFEEMQNEILPAMMRLAQALGEAANAVREIAQIYSQAEEETQSYYNSLGE
jgi:WXG100 family type VII secretion target